MIKLSQEQIDLAIGDAVFNTSFGLGRIVEEWGSVLYSCRHCYAEMTRYQKACEKCRAPAHYEVRGKMIENKLHYKGTGIVDVKFNGFGVHSVNKLRLLPAGDLAEADRLNPIYQADRDMAVL